MDAHNTNSHDLNAAEVDRYIAVPGQATSYMLGALEIRRLREQAEAALGDRFDIRAFHDLVLEDGAIPWTIWGKVERWIEQRKRQPPTPSTTRSNRTNTSATIHHPIDPELP
jgi:uncharacterized protein (DUF885 family)